MNLNVPGYFFASLLVFDGHPGMPSRHGNVPLPPYCVVISTEEKQRQREQEKENCRRDERGNTAAMCRKWNETSKKAYNAAWNCAEYRQ